VTLVPLTQRQAYAFVGEHHRHAMPPRGDVFRVGLEIDGELVAVAIAGRPIARELDDGRTLEITRLCVAGDRPNACSRLYAACCRASAALGYRRVVTYTLASEPGSSPRAAGFVLHGEVEARTTWANGPGRHRYDHNLFGETIRDTGPKRRWIRELA
jgi:hypothetical protein